MIIKIPFLNGYRVLDCKGQIQCRLKVLCEIVFYPYSSSQSVIMIQSDPMVGRFKALPGNLN